MILIDPWDPVMTRAPAGCPREPLLGATGWGKTTAAMFFTAFTAFTAVSLVSAPADALEFKKLLQGVEAPKLPGLPGGSGSAESSGTSLGSAEIGRGLKEALSRGAQRAVESLGRPDGFLGNAKVKIPMPGALSSIESALRAIGQDRYADQFVETLNRAAERAVPEAASIFGDAIRSMSWEDARRILQGPDNAATEYLKKVGSERLLARFRPIVEQATSSVGLTSAYKQLTGKAGFAGRLLGKDSVDLDGYVTGKAVDGLFTVVSEEEARIRRDPTARVTDLLKKVFR